MLSCVSPAGGEVPDIELELRVEIERPGTEAPSVLIRLRNVGRMSAGISETFLLPKKYFFLEIDGPTGRVEYPFAARTAELFGVRYRCLRPSEEIVFAVQLSSWLPVVSGKPRGERDDPLSFLFRPGDYRVRAVYASDEGGAHRRCPTMVGPIYSGWIPFSIAE